MENNKNFPLLEKSLKANFNKNFSSLNLSSTLSHISIINSLKVLLVLEAVRKKWIKASTRTRERMKID